VSGLGSVMVGLRLAVTEISIAGMKASDHRERPNTCCRRLCGLKTESAGSAHAPYLSSNGTWMPLTAFESSWTH